MFLKIHDIWIEIKKVYPDITQEQFNESILSLANQNIDQVELIQGVITEGEMILYDSISKTYYHYIKIKE